MPRFTTIELTLDQIAGRSPLNARPERLDDDVSGLAATIDAVGLLQKITVIRVDDDPNAYEVLAGWRRTKALTLLANDGRWREPFEAILFEGSTEDAIAASIAENTERRALHPAEEAEAFAMLAGHGQAPEDIAKHFGVTVRHVKGRLRLADVCPEVMARWKDGKLTLDAVQALSAGTHEQQRTLLADKSYSATEAWWIRSRLNSGKVAADDVRARYVGRDAYVAAGGKLDENLFGELDLFCDEALLDRLTKDKMLAEGEAIRAAEGWGFCVIDEDWDERSSFWLDRSMDLLDGEVEQIKTLEGQIEELTSEDDPDVAAIEAIEDKIAAIKAKAQLRAIPAASRGRMGISVELDENEAARLVVYRGWIKREDADDKPVKKAKAAETSGSPTADDEPAAKTSKALDGFLAVTRTNALREAVRIRPDLALVFATAALASFTNRVVHLRATISGDRHENQLARAAADCEDFEQAVVMLSKAPQGDVLCAFADLVAGAVAVGDANQDEIAAAFAAAAMRGVAIENHLRTAFDGKAYFAAAPKEVCVAALVAMDGRNSCISTKKSDIADLAATKAARFGWLPQELKKHCPIAPPEPEAEPEPEAKEPSPLAEEMADAIALDQALHDSVAMFIDLRCREAADVRIKSSTLLDAFNAQSSISLSIQTFGRIMKLLGYKTHRVSSGVHYLGIDLRPTTAQAAE